MLQLIAQLRHLGFICEIMQVITTLKVFNFLTPKMESKKDVIHGIDFLLVEKPDATSGIIFDAISGVKKLKST